MNENELYPAIRISKATGRELNVCCRCHKKFIKDDKIAELVTSAYKNNLSHTQRYCYRCFLKTLLSIFGELLTDRKLKKEMIKENILEKLQNGQN